MTRLGLDDKKLSEELIIDKEHYRKHYRKHPDIDIILCMSFKTEKMKNSLLLLLIFFIMVCNSIVYSQSLKHQFEINQFEIKSKSVKEEIYQ